MTKEFKVGDRVFDDVYCEWGEVIKDDASEYPVKVKFDSDGKTDLYYQDGKGSKADGRPRLHHEIPEWCIVPVGKQHEGQIIAVRQKESFPWNYRYLVEYKSDNENPYCCLDSAINETSDIFRLTWKYARELTEEEKRKLGLI